MNRSQQIISLSEGAQKISTVAEHISGIWGKDTSMKPRIFRVMPLSWFWAGTITKDQLDSDDADDAGLGDSGGFGDGGDFGGDGGGGE